MPPRSPDPSPTAAADLAACRAILRRGSKTFHAASLLLPRRARAPVTALYAFCRQADDAVDLATDPGAALPRLNDRLDRIYAGDPQPDPVDRAFAAVVARHGIPREWPQALLEGFAWDAAGRQYETLAQLQDYALRVAGTVGAMMALLLDVRDRAALARACELGVAMQLTNIARDVGEDARNGRLYLPLQWLREAGIDPGAWLAAPAFDPRLAGVIARLLRAAEIHYAGAGCGIAALPRACRPAINAARMLYAEIGRQLARDGYDAVARRTVVPARAKLRVAASALATPARALPEPGGIDAARFLLDALVATPATAPGRIAWWDLEARGVALIALFERLERADRGARRGSYS